MGGYKQLLSQVDYVEIHNGAALNANRILANRRLRCRLRKTVRRINWTLDLPVALRGVDLGWSVGSDAHLPVEQYVAGRTEQSPVQGESIFDFLKRRIKFFPYQLRDVPSHILGNNYRVVRSLGSAWTEFLNKKSLRLRKGLTGPGKQSSTP
ncbi:MAG: hypothetical protein D6E12_06285 [Desulfovibrio sp.]|nr:MAG: hypothetical protein D6E12_06285 [Desulfovibrio sp.]